MNQPKLNGKLISIHPCNKFAIMFMVYMKRDKNWKEMKTDKREKRRMDKFNKKERIEVSLGV